MQQQLIIEENVPYRRDWQSEIYDVAERMKQGDSVLVMDNRVRSRMCYAINKVGAVAVRRREGNGYRVWRMGPREA